jgi:hypothetical protein
MQGVGIGVSFSRVIRIACAVAAASVLAACDKCGDFVPPLRLQGDQMTQVCKDEAPKNF